jgi:hypothetical protein
LSDFQITSCKNHWKSMKSNEIQISFEKLSVILFGNPYYFLLIYFMCASSLIFSYNPVKELLFPCRTFSKTSSFYYFLWNFLLISKIWTFAGWYVFVNIIVIRLGKVLFFKTKVYLLEMSLKFCEHSKNWYLVLWISTNFKAF